MAGARRGRAAAWGPVILQSISLLTMAIRRASFRGLRLGTSPLFGPHPEGRRLSDSAVRRSVTPD